MFFITQLHQFSLNSNENKKKFFNDTFNGWLRAGEFGLSYTHSKRYSFLGLAFISYPMAIAKFDWFPQIFAVLFFLMLITLGLGSATGLTSAVIAIIADNKPEWNKTYVTLGVCICGFLIGTVYLTPVSVIRQLV